MTRKSRKSRDKFSYNLTILKVINILFDNKVIISIKILFFKLL